MELSKQKNYQQSFDLACASFKEMDLEERAKKAGADYHVLPFIPLQYVLWEGGEEFPSTVHLIFDASVDHYLSLEDIVVLGQMATGRLIHQSSRLQEGTPLPGRSSE